MAKKTKPVKKPKAAAKKPAKKPAKAASAKKPVPAKPSAGRKSMPAKKPAAGSRPVAARNPSAARQPVAPAKAVARQPVPPKRSAAGSVRAGRPSAIPAPILLALVPSAEAPSKFRREYRRWRDVLIALRQRLISEGSHLEEEGLKAQEQEVSVDHMADFGSDSSEQETTLQLIENNSISVRDVDDALKRIEAKSYGLCEDCEALIPPARLAVLPHARLCIACQSKREGTPA